MLTSFPAPCDRRFFGPLVFLLVLLSGFHSLSFAQTAIKVGLFQNKPIVYQDEEGPKGLFVEVLDRVAASEGWTLDYVLCELNDCLQQLATDQIDLMTSVGVSPERLQRFTFSTEPVWTFWGVVYAKDLSIHGILDLRGKEIGVRKNTNTHTALAKLLQDFEIPARLVEYDNYEEALRAIREGAIDAVAVNNTYIIDEQTEAHLHRTPIVFNPFAAYFATPNNGRHADKLAVIDAYVKRFKADPDSVLHLFERKWFGDERSFWTTRRITFLGISLVLLSVCGTALWRYRTLRALNRRLETSLTELSHAGRELRRSEERLLEAQEIAHLGRWELDLTTQRLEWSDSIFTLCEIDRDTFTPNYPAFLEMVHPDDRAQVDQAYRESLKTNTRYAIEHRLLMPDGRVKWVYETGRTECDERGFPLRSIGTVQDITERKQAEEARRESEKIFRELFNTASDAIYLSTENGRIVHSNNAASRMLGRPIDEITTLTIDQIDSDRSLDAFLAFWRTVPEDVPQLFETTHVRKDGSRFPVEVNATKFSINGRIYCLGIARDITERQRAEEDKRMLQAQLIHAQKMEALGTLAGGIAHDFNNILGAVLGYAEMARDASPAGSIVARDLDRVLEAAHRAADLVRQILAFSRQSTSERVPLDPTRIVKEAVKLLRPTLPSTISIRQQYESTAHVLADPTQLHQVVMNLCTNAFHAMEQAGGTLTISLEECELSAADTRHYPQVRPGKFVQLAISDTGAGIQPDIRSKIFDPYFTTKEVGKGTGMGLAIAHGIVTTAGGFIACESEPERGSVFRVFLPVFAQKVVRESRADGPVPTGQGHVLFVDDEEMLVEMGQAMLERLGYEVTIRTSSVEAWETFHNQPDSFDAVITDQTMPDLTGVELARRMLRLRPELPVILCTGYSNLIDEEQAKAEGIKGFAMKPLTKKEIASLLQRVLRSTAGA